MTSSIRPNIDAHLADAMRALEAMRLDLSRTESLASSMRQSTREYEEVVADLTARVRSRRGPWRTAGEDMVREWRTAEKAQSRERWNHQVKSVTTAIAACDPPRGLERHPSLDRSPFESRLSELTRKLEELDHRRSAIDATARQMHERSTSLLESCESLRDGR